MIGLSAGQESICTFNARNRLGRGILYLLNSSISFEVLGTGTVLELGYEDISYVKLLKQCILMISWLEGKETCASQFKAKDAKEIVDKIMAILKNPDRGCSGSHS